jgi:hypothetical protein
MQFSGSRARHRAAMAAVLAASALALTGGTARAATDDPCQDLRNQQRVHQNIAEGWWNLANAMDAVGAPTLADLYRQRASDQVTEARNADNSLRFHSC